MLNREKHQLMMGRILRDIYIFTPIAPLLGFKGGTAAYFFYGLPRFSVDLDFDIFTSDRTRQKEIFESLKKILRQHGEMKDSYMKLNTLFFLLSYGKSDHNIKLEINRRTNLPEIQNRFELKKYLGISMLVAKKSYLFASKLAALALRSETAMRDIYDIWYFAKNNWDIDANVITILTNKSIKKHLADCIAIIERVKDNQILRGIGELISEKEKIWVKTHLRTEVVFLLKNYRVALKM